MLDKVKSPNFKFSEIPVITVYGKNSSFPINAVFCSCDMKDYYKFSLYNLGRGTFFCCEALNRSNIFGHVSVDCSGVFINIVL